MSTGTDWTVAKLPPRLVNAADISHAAAASTAGNLLPLVAVARTHFQCISISLTELHFGLAVLRVIFSFL